MAKKDLITLLDYSGVEIREILRLAAELKAGRLIDTPMPFKGRTGVLIFEKPSLRTRITFETAIFELGGHPVNLEAGMVQMGKRETVEDVARNLERWVHLLVARTYKHETVHKLAKHSRVPVINALTDRFHPCQALAMGLTLQERRDIDPGRKIVFVGDGNNVCASLMVLAVKLGHDFALACPPGYELESELVEQCRGIAAKEGRSVTITHDLHEAVQGATVVYTDVWTSMGQEQESKKRAEDFSGFRVDDELLSHAPADVLVSHCLPAHRGEEITSEVLDSDKSMAFDEAENRLHAQKAVIVHLLS